MTTSAKGKWTAILMAISVGTYIWVKIKHIGRALKSVDPEQLASSLDLHCLEGYKE